ncbi:MAG: RNA 2',3'-cyclic phosphodiesterase [Bacillota bacterium]
MPRCFAAVEVAAPAVRRALEAAQFTLKRAFGPRDPVRWVASHQFHFTLKFFGEIEQEAVERAAAALGRAAGQSAPFLLEVAGLGAFPSPARPSVLWCGVGQGRTDLIALAERVEAEMALAGFPREARPFKPHLTLGRLREGAVAPPAVGEALKEARSYGSWQVERLVLMRSELLPAGPRYSILSEARLREENG